MKAKSLHNSQTNIFQIVVVRDKGYFALQRKAIFIDYFQIVERSIS